jgi:hypothetical protein
MRKLQNKKTGAFGYLYAKPRQDYEVLDERGFSFGKYESLEKVLSEWKEYGEPLIKDGNIRDAIKTWADANGFDKVFICSGFDVWGVRYDFGDVGSADILFRGEPPLEPGEQYSIEELCGVEE